MGSYNLGRSVDGRAPSVHHDSPPCCRPPACDPVASSSPYRPHPRQPLFACATCTCAPDPSRGASLGGTRRCSNESEHGRKDVRGCNNLAGRKNVQESFHCVTTRVRPHHGLEQAKEVDVRFPWSESPLGVVFGAGALPPHVSGGSPDFAGDGVDVWLRANGAAPAGTTVHDSSVGSNAPAGRRSCSPDGGTFAVETGLFFAKMSLMRYLVLVPREVLLPLGRPEGLVFSPSGTFPCCRHSVGSSVPMHGPTVQYTGILPGPHSHKSLVSPVLLVTPKNAFSARTNLSSRARTPKTGGSRHGRTRS